MIERRVTTVIAVVYAAFATALFVLALVWKPGLVFHLQHGGIGIVFAVLFYGFTGAMMVAMLDAAFATVRLELSADEVRYERWLGPVRVSVRRVPRARIRHIRLVPVWRWETGTQALQVSTGDEWIELPTGLSDRVAAQLHAFLAEAGIPVEGATVAER